MCNTKGEKLKMEMCVLLRVEINYYLWVSVCANVHMSPLKWAKRAAITKSKRMHNIKWNKPRARIRIRIFYCLKRLHFKKWISTTTTTTSNKRRQRRKKLNNKMNEPISWFVLMITDLHAIRNIHIQTTRYVNVIVCARVRFNDFLLTMAKKENATAAAAAAKKRA